MRRRTYFCDRKPRNLYTIVIQRRRMMMTRFFFMFFFLHASLPQRTETEWYTPMRVVVIVFSWEKRFYPYNPFFGNSDSGYAAYALEINEDERQYYLYAIYRSHVTMRLEIYVRVHHVYFIVLYETPPLAVVLFSFYLCTISFMPRLMIINRS